MSHADRIAVVGIGGLFAGAPTLDGFWQNILASGDASREVPPGRWRLRPEEIFDPTPGTADRVYSTRGYYVEDWECDPADFDLEPGLLPRLDAVFHLALRAADAAWRDAVTVGLDRQRVGAIFGSIVLPTDKASALAELVLIPAIAESLGLDSPPTLGEIEPLNCQAAGLPAKIVASALGLGGTAYTLDAACASSLFALKLAADELLSHRAVAMLTGGVCRPDCLYTQMGFSQLRALSQSGRCAPFDAGADGLLVGDGAGFFVLKRLDDALRHGDHVYGVIAGVGLSNDTKGNLLAPDIEGQLRAMRAAYAQAGWQPTDVDLIECHATGTPVGDRVELESLRELWRRQSFRPGQCVLGSVKANVGHTLTAAGSAGLLKILLALQHGILPPVANCTQPRPEFFTADSPFRLLPEPTAWRARGPGIPRRAAISAFGFGGTNAHVLIEEWLPQIASKPGRQGNISPPPCPFPSVRVVGGAARIGTAGEQCDEGSTNSRISVPADRWWGVEKSRWFQDLAPKDFLTGHRLIAEIHIAPADYPIPPRDLEEMLPQQLLMLQTAAAALANANWSKQHALRTGIFVGVALDPNTTNFQLRWILPEYSRRWSEELGWNLSEQESTCWQAKLREAAGPPLTPGRVLGALASTTASRIARMFGIGGPSFTISSGETAGLSALHAALSFLGRGEIDYAVVGAVEFPGDIRTMIGDFLEGIKEDCVQESRIEGAAVLVLRRPDATLEAEDRFSVPVENLLPARLQSPGAILGLLPVVECVIAVAGLSCRVISGENHGHCDTGSARKTLVIPVGHPALKIPFPATTGSSLIVPEIDFESQNGDSASLILPLPTALASSIPCSPGISVQLGSLVALQAARAEAHAGFLRFSQRIMQTVVGIAQLQEAIPLTGAVAAADYIASEIEKPDAAASKIDIAKPQAVSAMALNRQQCLEFATGSIVKVFGPEYAEVESFPTRVRLPAEPLMLVDRVLTIEGKPRSLEAGRIVTEHDIRHGDWYLDAVQMPAGITIESGQADLALAGYLGIDFQTRGLAVYRLLDATVTFHRRLPTAGEIARYDIHIDRFFRQGDTHLFRFRFDGTVGGEPLLTMTDGCAGFFSSADLAGGRGIVRGANFRPTARPPHTWKHLSPDLFFSKAQGTSEVYDEARLDALRAGNLGRCFGQPFDRLSLHQPLTLPGGRLRLIHQVSRLDLKGGEFGLGIIRGEQDIRPDDWFLTCHFIDDQVMPGTLMYECCLHTLRFFLLRLGWVAEKSHARFEPKPGVASRLKCRGQVIASTRLASYEITIKELGKEPHPYAIADALMFADGKPIVEITDITLQLSGVSYAELEETWRAAEEAGVANNPQSPCVFDRRRVLAFARGNPSEAFGERYQPFDRHRRLARLPAPPYSFIDRVVSTTAEQWKMIADGTAEVQYEIPVDAWYFSANRQPRMPFAILQEVALQSCGWLAAYCGSALTSPADLRFRNLGGRAIQETPVTADSRRLTTSVRFTKVVNVGDMIIQDYEFTVRDKCGVVLQGTTNFGFFTDQTMARQVGLKETSFWHPEPAELARSCSFAFPHAAPFPDKQLRMIHNIEQFILDGGPHRLGFIQGCYDVDPDAWFFHAHFFQDPVCPGSLGLEALLQLLKAFAARRFGPIAVFETPVLGKEHRWLYRGQIVPANSRVDVQAVITACDEEQRSLVADGWLSVDGLLIYQMNDFSLRVVE